MIIACRACVVDSCAETFLSVNVCATDADFKLGYSVVGMLQVEYSFQVVVGNNFIGLLLSHVIAARRLHL